MLASSQYNHEKQGEPASSSDHYSSHLSQEQQQHNEESSQNDNCEILDSQGQQINNSNQPLAASAHLANQINSPPAPAVKPTKNFNETTTNPNGSNSGKWTREEHLRFIKGLGIYGKNWKRVESFVSTRSGAQIRSHAQKFFSKLNRSEKNKGIKGGCQLQHGETSEDNNNSVDMTGGSEQQRQQSSQKVSVASEEQRDASEWMHYYKLLYATSEAELASATASGRSTPAELSSMQQQLNKISLIVSVLSAAQSLSSTQSQTPSSPLCDDNATASLASSMPSSPQPQSPMSPSGILALSLDHLSLNPTPLDLNTQQNNSECNSNNNNINSIMLDNNNNNNNNNNNTNNPHIPHVLSSFHHNHTNSNGHTSNIFVDQPIHNSFIPQIPAQIGCQVFQSNQFNSASCCPPMQNTTTNINQLHHNVSISSQPQPSRILLPTMNTNNYSQLQVLIPKRITPNANNTPSNYPQQFNYPSQQPQFIDSPASLSSPASSPYSLTNTMTNNPSELKLAPSFFEFFLKKYEGLFDTNQDSCPKLSQLITLSTSTSAYATPDKQTMSRSPSSPLSKNQLCTSPMFSFTSSPRHQQQQQQQQLNTPQLILSSTSSSSPSCYSSASPPSSCSSPFQSFTQSTITQQPPTPFGIISQFNPDSIIENTDVSSPVSANNINARKRQSSFSICQNNNSNTEKKKIKLNPNSNSTSNNNNNNAHNNTMNNFMQLVNSNITLNDNINSSQSTYFLPFILANNNNNTNTISIMNLPK